ncbi:hypothetical protein [Serratia ureilytica]|uniref:hypothetical protein n=1 Tax=Serratia ureilytica TaxID=300181 RepID=UPI00313E0D4B
MFDRFDYSHDLFHWVKTGYEGEDEELADNYAYDVMVKIIKDGFLISSGKDTFKRIKSICFTESPLEIMKHQTSKYTKFGFAFNKVKIFEMGGRHVIYQPKCEACNLPKSLHWRHVTYDPTNVSFKRKNGVNFTWEREWRLNEKELSIKHANKIIVPNAKYADKILRVLYDGRNINEAYWLFGSDSALSPDDYDQYTDCVKHLIVVFDQIQAA